MIHKLLNAYHRQLLLWKLRGLQGWREELSYSAQKVREAQHRNQQEIEITRARLAKLDGEAMLMGQARVVIRRNKFRCSAR